MRIIRHGHVVTVRDIHSGKSTTGRLHLPDDGGTGPRYIVPGLQVVTIILPDGSRFRTQGRVL